MSNYSNTNGNIKKLIRADNNVICDVCSRKRKRSECVLAFGTGDIPVIMSCIDGCADYRHPLNSPPPVIFDGQPVPDARPDVSSTSSAEPYVTVITPSCMSWGHLSNAGAWGKFNDPNNAFNMSGIWTWGTFVRN